MTTEDWIPSHAKTVINGSRIQTRDSLIPKLAAAMGPSRASAALSLSESHFILGSLPHPTPAPAICFAHWVPTKGKRIENRESTFYTVVHTHKRAVIATLMTSHLLKRTEMIKKNPPFIFITEELLLNPEFQSTFFQNSARWSGRGQGGEEWPHAQHCPWPPPAPGTLRSHLTEASLPPPVQKVLCVCFSGQEVETSPQDAAT